MDEPTERGESQHPVPREGPAQPEPQAQRPERVADAEPGTAEDPRSARLHDLLALGTVLMLILAAAAAWRASVSEEHGSHFQALARQERLHEQQAKLGVIDAVVADMRKFGDFERASLLYGALRKEASHVSAQRRDDIAHQWETELRVARVLAHGSTSGVAFPQGSNGTMRKGDPYFTREVAETYANDIELAVTPEITPLDRKAHAARGRGHHLVGVGALFVAAAFLFTIGSVLPGAPPRWLGAAGLVVALAAIVLFLLTSAPPWNSES
jgi:hypothetical protein